MFTSVVAFGAMSEVWMRMSDSAPLRICPLGLAAKPCRRAPLDEVM